jgi:hypothetical protein
MCGVLITADVVRSEARYIKPLGSLPAKPPPPANRPGPRLPRMSWKPSVLK